MYINENMFMPVYVNSACHKVTHFSDSKEPSGANIERKMLGLVLQSKSSNYLVLIPHSEMAKPSTDKVCIANQNVENGSDA